MSSCIERVPVETLAASLVEAAVVLLLTGLLVFAAGCGNKVLELLRC